MGKFEKVRESLFQKPPKKVGQKSSSRSKLRMRDEGELEALSRAMHVDGLLFVKDSRAVRPVDTPRSL